MRIKVARHWVDMGPVRRPVALPHSHSGVLPEGETWSAVARRGYEYRVLLRQANTKRREEARLLERERRRLARLRACPRCGRQFTPVTRRAVYCTDTCRKAAWKGAKRAR